MIPALLKHSGLILVPVKSSVLKMPSLRSSCTLQLWEHMTEARINMQDRSPEEVNMKIIWLPKNSRLYSDCIILMHMHFKSFAGKAVRSGLHAVHGRGHYLEITCRGAHGIGACHISCVLQNKKLGHQKDHGRPLSHIFTPFAGKPQ